MPIGASSLVVALIPRFGVMCVPIATTSEASASDTQLSATLRQYEGDFGEMRSAWEADEADVLF